jgi:putative protease
MSSTDSRISAVVPELLAPAGSVESLRAAVNNGADAVYLGVDRLNARRKAPNFTVDELSEATRFAHLRGARVYLTANVVVLQHEMGDALGLLDDAWAAGVDAFILQDLGLARLAARELPHVRLHASTQIGAHNSATLAELERIGFSRVTLARETSVAEIATLAAASSLEIESFVHGALCVCYSGQCLMSSMIGGRSANRGLCAQPCRLAYDLLDAKASSRAKVGSHLLSPKDLCGIDALPRLVEAGVTALKIEGRMKAPEYVALVTGIYRQALDRALADPDGFEVAQAERSILDEAFTRGFSSAYLDEIRDDRMMSYARPNNRGVQIGRVSRVADGVVSIALDTAIDAEDTVEFWTSRGHFAQKVGQMRLSGEPVTVAPAGITVTLRAERAVAAGDRVFRVVNASLERAARRTFADERGQHPLLVDVSVRVVVGRPLRVELRAADASGAAEGPVVEAARTKPITAAEISEHVGRFGGTLFEPASWDLEVDAHAGLSYSVLHRIRREAVLDLERRMLEPWAGRSAAGVQLTIPPGRARRAEVPEIVVHTSDLRVAKACLGAGAQRAIVPTWVLTEAEEIPDRIVAGLPRVAHDREVTDLVRAAEIHGSAAVGNLGLLRPLAGAGVVTEADWGLNVANPWSLESIAETGASFAWLSPELSGRQIDAIAGAASVPVGVSMYGRQELMVTEHCVLMSIGPCTQVCGTCVRREGWYALRDAKGYAFPVMTDPMGRSHIHNSVVLDLTRALPEIVAAGVAAVRLDFTVEHVQEAQRITKLVREAIAAVVSGKHMDERPLVTPATAGHFYRGLK